MYELNPTEDEFLYLSNEQLLLYEESTPLDKKKYRNVYCVNCGEKGHVVKDCEGPITSFGIIAFKMVYNKNDEKYDKNRQMMETIKTIDDNTNGFVDVYPKVKFLMIQRKDTMGYIDFIRGKYPDDEVGKNRMLNIFLQEMIPQEKESLLTKDFNTLWSELWLNKASKTYRNEYGVAKQKYTKLDVRRLVENSKTHFKHTEFSFPKGRRGLKENNIACAEREFFEETGYTKEHYEFIKNYPTVHEEFVGTNGVRYRHIYYLVKMKDNIPPPRVDYTNILQVGEVQNLGWLTYDECMRFIRPYDSAKKKCLRKVYYDILEMNENFICSNFYYNNRRLPNRQSGIYNPRSPMHDYRTSDYFKNRSL
jgi:8-oxo-dGTP pyrophosphatase MutT (NUDIX family)